MTEQVKEESGVTRRDFLKVTSGVALGVVVGGVLYKLIPVGDGVVAYAASEGYLLVDTKKCCGCDSCMLACSLVHAGQSNLSLSRIQVLQDPYGSFPNDIAQSPCRQCVYPACAEACPTGALHADKDNGGARIVDEGKCIGCMSCIEACPYEPARVQWNPDEANSQKCDLCADTPYWSEDGGVGGKQACAEICPMRCIRFTSEIPSQEWDVGYDVNMRTAAWGHFGMPTD
jgi:protein NrfC